MGIFSRTRDIFAANFTELLDRAEDPARMIRMIILEMEETLVEVRASAARSIADSKEMKRALVRLDELQASWTEKAELALSKEPRGSGQGGADRAAEGRRHGRRPAARAESIEETLKGYEADIAKLQGKLREARARQNAIATRIESAVTRARAREILNGSRTEDAFSRFDQLERRADFAEGRADALGMTGPKSLEEENCRASRDRQGRRRAGSDEGGTQGQGGVSGRTFCYQSLLFDPVHRPAVAHFPLHHQVEDRGDADRVGRKAAR